MKKKRPYDFSELESIASSVRGRVIQMSHAARAAHLGSALSCIDILVAMYWNFLNLDQDDVRDRFILSKGHAAAALYAVLAFKGILPLSSLDTYCLPGSLLEDHPGPSRIRGIEAATGSLGHGLSIGTGMSLADRLQKRKRKTIVMVSDGECNEGSVWEAAMYAAGRKLESLIAIIDFNKWQATGRSIQITGIEPLAKKWKAFGWRTIEIDGHNMAQIHKALAWAYRKAGRPAAIIAHTVKGKGVSFMEDDNNWHYRIPSQDEVSRALNELGVE